MTAADLQGQVREAAGLMRAARHLTVFTGAGISTESGVPAFRGPGGLWSRYDPRLLEIAYFRSHPLECWRVLREIFYEHFSAAQPNEGHKALARLESRGLLRDLITQNIDGLHQRAGSQQVIEFHGSSTTLVCTVCGSTVAAEPRLLQNLPPRCRCSGVLKPTIVFFGEGIPETAWRRARQAAEKTDVMLVIGSTGEVHPAASLPFQAAAHGAHIVEVNPTPSAFTDSIAELVLALPAGQALPAIEAALYSGAG